MKKVVLLVFFLLAGFTVVLVIRAGKTDQSVQPVGEVQTTTTKAEMEVPQLTLDTVFGAPDLSRYPKEELTTIIMTGDIIPSRQVNAKVVGYGDFTRPYLKTADYLKSSDLTVTNLEAPLLSGCPVTSSGMTFCGDPRHVEGLVFAGIDVASVANNHAGNYGKKGLAETKKILSENSIDPVGLGGTSIREVKGVKYAFLAYNGVSEDFDLDQIKREIAEARSKADVIIVLPHWGAEYVRVPKISPGIADQDPREVGKKMVDGGADLILGNHPHWYQGIEVYKGKLIAYAHGNFVFDQDWSEETMLGVVGKYTFYKGKIVAVSYRPIKIGDLDQPYFLEGATADAIINTMKQNSFEE